MYRIIPCLLLKDKGLVKTYKFNKPRYIGDPVNTVKIFNEKEVDELIFLDIRATIYGRKPDIDLIHDIASESFMPICYGGGITKTEEIKEILYAGVEKVALNAAAFEKPKIIENAARNYGSQSIVVSIDVKKNWLGRHEVFLRNGTKATGLDPVEYALQVQEAGCGELLVNSIDRDGTMQGYDLDLLLKISRAVEIPVIALGGSGRFEDFDQAIKIGGASAVAAGSIFVYYGKNRAVLINYPTRDKKYD
jgi:cyclase